MSAMVWNSRQTVARTMVQYSDAERMDMAMATTTDREVRVPVQRAERRALRSNWVKTPGGLRLRWVAGE